MIASQLRHRRLLLGAAAACYAGVLVSFVVFERSGLGIGHFFYVAIVVAAMATGVLGGAVAGLVATALYALGVYLNSHVPTGTIPTEGTAIRLVTYTLVGGLIGYYASHSRALLARADALTDELRALARRDFVTGLPNQRAFEIAVNARIEEGQPFVLVVCDLPPVPRGADERNQALAFGERLGGAVGPESDVARIGNGQFAAVVPAGEEQAGGVTDRVEVAIGSHGRRGTVGWATFPRDGADALGLYTSAAERLYARKISRGEWQLPATVTPIDR
ncbi:MAG TPA: GGDEF domain-containing protein [Gaiellaceae bacterium]